MSKPVCWYGIETIKRRNADMNRHFFDADTMRFFNSRVCANVFFHSGDYGRAWFVTSERFGHTTPRLFSVHVFDWETGRVNPVSDFQKYTTARAAKSAAKKAAQAGLRA